MKVTGPEGSIQIENQNRALSYRTEFKHWVKENPGVIARVVKLIEKILSNNLEVTENRLVDENIHIIHKKQPYSDIFEVTIGQDKFFIKRDEERLRNTSSVYRVGGQKEYTDSLIAKIDLGDDPDIEIIDFQLGYSDKNKKRPINYFVSKWKDLKTVSQCLDDPDSSVEEKEEIIRKVSRAKWLFQIYQDIKTDNMFYNPVTRKIVMFDLNINPNLAD